MAERGAQPRVPRGRRMFLRLIGHLFRPLRPDDYLEMVNPLWTTKELRGRVERVEPQGSEAASGSSPAAWCTTSSCDSSW
jgi:hypothetical protein